MQRRDSASAPQDTRANAVLSSAQLGRTVPTVHRGADVRMLSPALRWMGFASAKQVGWARNVPPRVARGTGVLDVMPRASVPTWRLATSSMAAAPVAQGGKARDAISRVWSDGTAQTAEKPATVTRWRGATTSLDIVTVPRVGEVSVAIWPARLVPGVGTAPCGVVASMERGATQRTGPASAPRGTGAGGANTSALQVATALDVWASADV